MEQGQSGRTVPEGFLKTTRGAQPGQADLQSGRLQVFRELAGRPWPHCDLCQQLPTYPAASDRLSYFLGADQQAGNNDITVEVGDDILVAGYPSSLRHRKFSRIAG